MHENKMKQQRYNTLTIAIFCKNGTAMPHEIEDTNPMSTLIIPKPTENDFNCIGHGISNV